MPGGRQSVEGIGAVEAALVGGPRNEMKIKKSDSVGGGFLRDNGDGIPLAVVGLLRIE